MANNPITVLKMTTVNSSVAVSPTLAGMDCASGLYVDCSHIDASRMILVFTRTASGAITSSGDRITITHGGDTAGYSAYGLGDLDINACTGLPATAVASEEMNCMFAGPFETARFKDSVGRINILCTNATNISAAGAILI